MVRQNLASGVQVDQFSLCTKGYFCSTLATLYRINRGSAVGGSAATAAPVGSAVDMRAALGAAGGSIVNEGSAVGGSVATAAPVGSAAAIGSGIGPSTAEIERTWASYAATPKTVWHITLCSPSHVSVARNSIEISRQLSFYFENQRRMFLEAFDWKTLNPLHYVEKIFVVKCELSVWLFACNWKRRVYFGEPLTDDSRYERRCWHIALLLG